MIFKVSWTLILMILLLRGKTGKYQMLCLHLTTSQMLRVLVKHAGGRSWPSNRLRDIASPWNWVWSLSCSVLNLLSNQYLILDSSHSVLKAATQLSFQLKSSKKSEVCRQTAKQIWKLENFTPISIFKILLETYNMGLSYLAGRFIVRPENFNASFDLAAFNDQNPDFYVPPHPLLYLVYFR